jgi:multidrug efflux pump subunit AcrA (membrane-fusion protein)
VIGAIAGLAAFLYLYPVEFKLEGDGRLRPMVRRNVWAEVDGEVQEVRVKHDQQVKSGDILVVQRSRELEKEIEGVNGELNKNAKTLEATNKELFDNDELTEAERNQRQREVKELGESIKSLQKQLELLRQKQEKLQIRTPIDGKIVTWNPEERLLDRPVSRGENLLEVADPSKDWELEVHMPEKRMGHIAKARAANGKLPVTFFLATNPGLANELHGEVQEIERSAEVRGEEGNTVLVRVSFDQEELRRIIADPKIGATATAKIHCGQRSIGYVWFHDLVDFIRAKILFRLF